MLLFAYAGLIFGAAAAAAGLTKQRGLSSVAGWPAALARYLDIRWLMIGSLLPDIIDKPLRQYILPGPLVSRGPLAGSLGGATADRPDLAGRTRPRYTLPPQPRRGMAQPARAVLAAAGNRFQPIDIEGWAGQLWQTLISDPGVSIPEIAGFIILAWFGLLLLRRRRVGEFLIRGG